MKKIVSLLLAFVMCLSLAACGGPNKQPAIDAHNRAGTAINELTEVLNQDPEAYSVYYDDMSELIDMLNQAGAALENENLDQDTLDEWASICKEIEQWAVDAKAELEN